MHLHQFPIVACGCCTCSPLRSELLTVCCCRIATFHSCLFWSIPLNLSRPSTVQGRFFSTRTSPSRSPAHLTFSPPSPFNKLRAAQRHLLCLTPSPGDPDLSIIFLFYSYLSPFHPITNVSNLYRTRTYEIAYTPIRQLLTLEDH